MDDRLLWTTIASLLASAFLTAACAWAVWHQSLKWGLYLLIGLNSLVFAVIYLLVLLGRVDSQRVGELYLRQAAPGLLFLVGLLALIDATKRRR